MKITSKRIKELIREEVQLMMEEKRLNGETLPQARIIVNPDDFGFGRRGQSVIITKGWGGTDPDQFQVHLLPKPAGEYSSFKDAINNGMSGESYYASTMVILRNSSIDTMLRASAEGDFKVSL
ncbi:hypothetical protein OAA09_00005 [bacterium]|nr:hypothetical protein [bacterium]